VVTKRKGRGFCFTTKAKKSRLLERRVHLTPELTKRGYQNSSKGKRQASKVQQVKRKKITPTGVSPQGRKRRAHWGLRSLGGPEGRGGSQLKMRPSPPTGPAGGTTKGKEVVTHWACGVEGDTMIGLFSRAWGAETPWGVRHLYLPKRSRLSRKK